MNEVETLKVLWFIAGGIASASVFLSFNGHTPMREKIAASLIPLIICTALYVIARAAVVQSPGM